MTSKRCLRVAYITTCFPVPSETFACVELSELMRRDVEATVYSLGPAIKSADSMLEAYGLQDIKRSSYLTKDLPRYLFSCLKSPRKFSYLLARVLGARPSSLKQWMHSIAIIPRVIGIYDELERKPPDVVHFFWGHYPILVAVLLERFHPTQKWSMSLGAYDLRMRFPLTLQLASDAGHLRVLSRENVDELAEMGVQNPATEVVYHGIDLDDREDQPDRIAGRMLYAGRLIPQKGLRETLVLYERIKERFPEASLVIAGEGEMRNELMELIEERKLKDVSLIGHVSQVQLRAEMRKSDLFVFLSHSESENLPNVVKEAMACGCRCVVSESTSIDELIPTEDHGWVVPPRDVEAAFQAVLRLLESNDDAMRQRSRQWAMDKFSVESSVTRLLERWWNLVGQARGDSNKAAV